MILILAQQSLFQPMMRARKLAVFSRNSNQDFIKIAPYWWWPIIAVMIQQKLPEMLEPKSLTRQNDDKRGKGFALDFGVGHLRANPPEVVIIVDADCLVQDGAIARLSIMARKTAQPTCNPFT